MHHKIWVFLLVVACGAAMMLVLQLIGRKKKHETFDSRIPHAIPAYIINLADQKDRLDKCVRGLGGGGIVHVVKAIDGRDIDPQLMSSLPPDRTRGEFACTLSHMKALGLIAASRYPVGIILEDDADMNIVRDMPKIKRVLRDAPAGWDAICLGANHVPSSKNVGPGLVKLDGDLYGAHAIMYTREAARKLGDLENNYELPWDFDVKRKLSNTFLVAHPAIVKTRPGSQSSTQGIR